MQPIFKHSHFTFVFLIIENKITTLAGNLLVRHVFIPTSDNPADEPSRGIRSRPVRKKHLSKPHGVRRTLCKSRIERIYDRRLKTVHRLAELGIRLCPVGPLGAA